MKNLWNKFTDKFGETIFHPQFIMLSYKKRVIEEIVRHSKSKKFHNPKLIDVGCGRMPYRIKLEPNTGEYIGVDHPQISKIYDSEIKPEILCDITNKIPVKKEQFDIAIMLEVLEYLENPSKTFSEIHRILNAKGLFIFTSPFMYPLHDIPYDRNRFTETQIRTFLEKNNFKVIKFEYLGNFISFWFQSMNVFLLKRIMDIIETKKSFIDILYLIFLITITPFCVIFSNAIFLLTRNLQIGHHRNYFPLDFLVTAVK